MRSIFEEVDDRKNSIESDTAQMVMVTTNPRGRTRSRNMQSWNVIEGEDNKSLITFPDPGNVRRTGFLTVREKENTDQRLYLPSVGRIQTIRSAERGDDLWGVILPMKI